MRPIDADKLKEEIYNRKRTPDDMKYMRIPAELVYQFIDNAPTVKQPQGEWIDHWSEDLQKMGFRQCSKCKAGYQLYEHGIRKSDLSWIDGQQYTLQRIGKFCPNCGARMKGGAE